MNKSNHNSFSRWINCWCFRFEFVLLLFILIHSGLYQVVLLNQTGWLYYEPILVTLQYYNTEACCKIFHFHCKIIEIMHTLDHFGEFSLDRRWWERWFYFGGWFWNWVWQELSNLVQSVISYPDLSYDGSMPNRYNLL